MREIPGLNIVIIAKVIILKISPTYNPFILGNKQVKQEAKFLLICTQYASLFALIASIVIFVN